MRKLLAAAAIFALSIIWACHLGPEDSQDHFDLIGDSAWTECDNVMVVLLDKGGSAVDTLFDGELNDISQLKNLSAAGYDGTAASLHISGTQDGGVCFDEKRTFQGDGQSLKIDTIKSLTAEPRSVELEPDSISIALDAAAIPVKASILPAYADQAVTWDLAGEGIVSRTIPAGGTGNQVKIKPEKIGSTTIRVRSAKDTSKSALLKVTVTAPLGISVDLSKESLVLYLGGPGDSLAASVKPATVDQKVIWSSMNSGVATVDSAGRVESIGIGETYVNARSVSTEANGSALVIVKRDVPVLTVASKTGAPVNSRITFSPRSTQAFGSIVMYKWDLAGDGEWDDSSSLAGIGEVVDLQPQSTSYAKEGTYTARFLVRDSEGNESAAQVSVDIGNQAPEITALRAEASISIKDSLSMTASVRDVDGKVAWCGWDYDGNGVYDDSITAADSAVEVVLGHRYPDAGLQLAVFKAMDETGKTRLDTVKIKVELDRPVADAGEDTTVTVGSAVNLHLNGTDKYGKIEKREVRFHGSGLGFIGLSKPDTTISAPAEPGTYLVVLKLTDDDGLVDVDSMNVTVVLSANAELTSLAFSAGPLDPSFKPTIQFFSARAAYGDSSVTVTPTAKDPASTISVNAKPVASGSASDPVKLVVGSNLNVFQIVVTSADGTQRVYTLSVARDPSADATLSKLDVAGFALKPAFAPTTVEYADTVPNAVSSITLKPTLAVSTASLAFNDSAMASGTATFPQPLAIGENVFKVVVTSQSGTASTSYRIKVIRRAKLELTRSVDGKIAVTDSSEVVPGVQHSIQSAPVTGHHFVKWSITEGTAVLIDPEANPASLTLQSAKVRAQADFAVNTYAITAGANAGGGISPSGIVSVDHGQNQAFTISTSTGNRLKSLTVDGSDVTTALVNGIFTFSKVAADHSINAAFVKLATITTTVGPGGSILPAMPIVILDEGSDTAFAITPKDGFKIDKFEIDGKDAKADLVGNKYTFKAISGSRTLAVTFIEGFTLTGVDDAGATVTPNSVGVNRGDTQVFTLAPKSADYRITGLLDNGIQVFDKVVNNTYTLTGINAPHIMAVISKRLYTVTVDVSGNGMGKADPTAIVEAGTGKTFKYEAAPGSRLTSFKVDGVEEKPTGSYTFSAVASNHTLSLVFSKVTYPLTAAVTLGAGTITPASATVDSNGSQKFTFAPAPNYRFHSLIDNDKTVLSLGAPVEYNLGSISAKHDLKIEFWRRYTVTATASTFGAFEISSALVDSTKAVSVVVKPIAGYRIAAVYDNGAPIATDGATWGEHKFGLTDIKANHVISADFQRYFTVTGSTNNMAMGSLSPDSQNVDEGKDAYFKIIPEAGYQLISINDDGVISVPPFNEYVSVKVSKNHDVAATFGLIPPDSYRVRVLSNARTGSTKASVGPPLSLALSKGETFTSDSVDVSVSSKLISAQISATDKFESCPTLRCITIYFQYWDIGGKKVLKNPLAIDLSGDFTARAIYGDAAPALLGVTEGVTEISPKMGISQ